VNFLFRTEDVRPAMASGHSGRYSRVHYRWSPRFLAIAEIPQSCANPSRYRTHQLLEAAHRYRKYRSSAVSQFGEGIGRDYKRLSRYFTYRGIYLKDILVFQYYNKFT